MWQSVCLGRARAPTLFQPVCLAIPTMQFNLGSCYSMTFLDLSWTMLKWCGFPVQNIRQWPAAQAYMKRLTQFHRYLNAAIVSVWPFTHMFLVSWYSACSKNIIWLLAWVVALKTLSVCAEKMTVWKYTKHFSGRCPTMCMKWNVMLSCKTQAMIFWIECHIHCFRAVDAEEGFNDWSCSESKTEGPL